MFSIFGGDTQTRRLPGRFQVPWKEILLVAIIVIALAAIGYGANWFVSRASENTSAPAVVPGVQHPAVVLAKLEVRAVPNPQEQTNSQTTTDQSTTQPFDPSTSSFDPEVLRTEGLGVQDLRPVQQVPVVVAPVTPTVVDYQVVVWTEVRDFDPSTIPVEEGFYSGQYLWSLYPNTTKGEDSPFPPELEQKLHSTRYLDTSMHPHPDVRGKTVPAPMRARYAWRILPHLEGLLVAVSATRDETSKNIVLASMDADRYGPYLLLSVDGEKSWCRFNLLPIVWEGQKTNGVTPEETRIVAQGEEIHLYGRYARGPGPGHLYWWETVVKKSNLPCS